MPTAMINGVRIHYLQAGSGPDLVMLHGLAADLSFWYLRVLPRLTDRWRVTLYDLRGHGFSEVTPRGYTTVDLADDLRGILDHLGIERPHLAAHSYGGAVALHQAVRSPDRVRSLALFDTRIPALQPLPDEREGRTWRERREALRAQGLDVQEATPKVLYSLLEDLAAEHGAAAGGSPWKPGSRVARRWERLRRETSLAGDVSLPCGLEERALSRVRVPVLLSFGGLSRSLETCRTLEKCLPDHRTVIHPGLGHFFPSVRPELVVEDLRAFLDEVESAPRDTQRA